MKFTDLFIHRPVLATVVSLMILLLGARAGTELTVREYPEIQNAVVAVTTAYVGADAELVQGFVTTPLERAISEVDGISYLTSTSNQGVSTISAYLDLDKDANEALSEIANKVNSQRSNMPEGSEDSVVALSEAGGNADAYIAFYSDIVSLTQIQDYLLRSVLPELSAIDGMEKVELIGSGELAMRIWLKPDRLHAFNLTASEVADALRANNFLAAVGESRGRYIRVPLKLQSDLSSVEEFRRLVVRSDERAIVRLEDVATVTLGADSYTRGSGYKGRDAVFIGVTSTPTANVVDVMEVVRDALPPIFDRLPQGIVGELTYDSTNYINDAIAEVRTTLIEAVVIVIVVIFLFLGSVRSVLIPAVTVPLSMIGAFALMLAMGFSINLLTLLAMVLAIGMVVDDAIVVLENVHRHIEEGKTPFDAAIVGARELVGPIIAMTITLVAVYLPIGFQGGLTGKLFTEFAFTLAGAVLLSGVIALTLTPMMCSRLLRPAAQENSRLARWLDARFESLRGAYERGLHSLMDTPSVMIAFGAVVLLSCGLLFVSTPSELAPEEDTGFFIALQTADAYASLDTLKDTSRVYAEKVMEQPETWFTFELQGLIGDNKTLIGTALKSWGERTTTTQTVVQRLQQTATSIPGVNTAVIVPPALPTAGQGFPVEFVIRTTRPPEDLARVANETLGRAMGSGKFIFLDSDLKIDRPQVRIDIDRDKAALLGIDMARVGSDLSTLLSGNYVNRFSLDGQSYKVIPQVEEADRLTPEDLVRYDTRARDGSLVPISTLATLEQGSQPQTLNHFQQYNSATLAGVQRPGVPLGEALETLEGIARSVMPRSDYSIDYAGQARQFKQEGSALVGAFVLALVLIYLVLAAQFESFRDPVIMLVTVPMSICGALIFINLLGMFQVLGASLNIYTQVGLVTLIGVIAKHGILIVEFANKLQEEGVPKRQAIEDAASIRLRPVLMTTAALVIAMVPLLLANGPGSNARFAMGLVIASGMTVGTLFTLYVVPAVYLYLGQDHHRKSAASSARS